MSAAPPSRGLFAPASPTVAIEVTGRRVTVAALSGVPAHPTVSAYASEPLPDGAVSPNLTDPNVPTADPVVAALRKALEQAGLRSTRRVALVVPDAVARVSFVTLATPPARASELDAVLRWQIRKSVPFNLDDARISPVVAHRDSTGTTFAVVVARRQVIAEYEAITDALNIHAGLVDVAGFNLANLVLSTGTPAGDSLVVNLAPEGVTLVILRGADLMFYRHRTGASDEPLGALVHQTAMYHADRLGGARFQRIWLAGGADPAARAAAVAQIEDRLGVTMQAIDIRPAVTLHGPDLSAHDVEALAAPVGIILRDGRAA